MSKDILTSKKVQVECPYCAEEDFQHDDVKVKCWKCGGEYRTKLNLSPKQTSKYILIILSVLLVGCDTLTNDEVIVEKEKCKAAGMDYKIYMTGTDKVRGVVCKKKEQSK
jgi:hypothetical protein